MPAQSCCSTHDWFDVSITSIVLSVGVWGFFFKSYMLRLVEPHSICVVNVSPLPTLHLSGPSKQLQQETKCFNFMGNVSPSALET